MKDIIMNLQAEKEADWWDKMSSEQKEIILEGIGQANQGRTVPHEEVVKMFGQWGLK